MEELRDICFLCILTDGIQCAESDTDESGDRIQTAGDACTAHSGTELDEAREILREPCRFEIPDFVGAVAVEREVVDVEREIRLIGQYMIRVVMNLKSFFGAFYDN